MKTALYLRISTKDQSLENQRPVLEHFAAALGWNVVATFVDRESGAKAARPGFKAMLAAASRHEFDVLLVWSLDRFTREGIGRTCDYLRQLAGWRVAFRSYSEPFLDTTNAFGELVASIFAFFAGFERQRLGERVVAGMDRARRNGKHFGRPRLVVRRDHVATLRAQGRSLRQIGAELGISHASVQRSLRAI